MKVSLEFEGNKKVLEVNQTCIFTGNNYRKLNDLSEVLFNGFNGKDKMFFVDNMEVSKGRYKVYTATSNSMIGTEFKLTSKSLLLTPIMEVINEEEEVFNEISKSFSVLEDKINTLFSEIENDAKISLHLDDYISVIKNYLDYELLTESSNSENDVYIKMLLMLAKQDCIIILNLLNSSLSTMQLLNIVYVARRKNLNVFIITNDSYFLSLMQKNTPIYVVERNIVLFEDLIRIWCKLNYSSLDYIDQINGELKIISSNLLVILIPYFCLLIVSCERDELIEFLRKNGIFSNEIINNLEKFYYMLKDRTSKIYE